jgi:cytochrome b561
VDTKEKFSPITITLHWLIAISIVCLLIVGFYMATAEVWSLYPIHKSFGIVVFVLAIVRILWRIKNGWPIPVRDYPAWEHKLAVLTHWILIIGTVVMPLSGFIFSGAGGYGVEVFGLTIAPSNPDPVNPGHVIPFNKEMSDGGHEVHELVGLMMAGVILLHVAGALKHHIIDKDRTLLRMLGK